MACTNPLHAFDTGFKTELGKPLYKITSSKILQIKKPKNKDKPWSQNQNDVWNDIFIKDYIEIPCQKCIGCRLKYSQEWANRCLLEARDYASNYFLTLTYDDENLPINKNGGINTETGEVLEEVPTLKPDDLEKFMKDLRRYYEYHYNWKATKENPGIRFYACGEYGEKRGRPHYHIILFNTPIDDLEIDHKNKNGNLIYTSKTIQKIWKKGIIGIGEVTWESCAYTARYMMKKQKGPNSEKIANDRGQVPEFVRMSRRPGIGFNYFVKNKGWIYESDEIFIKNQQGVQKLKPGRYYDKLFDIEQPEKMAAIKLIRQEISKNNQNNLKYQTDKTYEEILNDKAESKEQQIRKLIRCYENGERKI